MSRFDTSRFGTEPKHFDLANQLDRLLVDIETTRKANERIGEVQAQNIKSSMDVAKAELSQCGTHQELVDWLADIEYSHPTTIDYAKGHWLISGLDACRTSYRFERR